MSGGPQLTEKDAHPLQLRYIDLSGRYKAAWTFHRFLEGLQRFFGRQDLADQPFDFPAIYRRLKEASASLESSGASPITEQLGAIDSQLTDLVRRLDELDQKVSPSLLRLFFHRIRTYDEKVLIEMVRFYQDVHRGRSWEPDRIDKVDFLLSRLADALAGPDRQGDQTRLTRVLDGLSTRVRNAPVEPQELANRRKMIEAVRQELRDLSDFEQLSGKDLVSHYRRLKHGLGGLYFERSLLPLIVDTNGLMSRRFRSLSQREEERIFVDYERVSQMERADRVDPELVDAVSILHLQVDRFRQQAKSGNLRMSDLVELRETLKRIAPQLGGEPETAAREVSPPAETPWQGRDFALGAAFDSRRTSDLLAPYLEELVTKLSGFDPGTDPETVAAAGDLVRFRLHPREVRAFQRLVAESGDDEQLERFLLGGAALRRRISHEVEEIRATRDQAADGGSPLPAATAKTLAAADWYLRQFSHFFEHVLLEKGTAEAREIQTLRMRLMRDYSGLWLLVKGAPPAAADDAEP